LDFTVETYGWNQKSEANWLIRSPKLESHKSKEGNSTGSLKYMFCLLYEKYHAVWEIENMFTILKHSWLEAALEVTLSR